jgi:predicted DNA-binding protein
MATKTIQTAFRLPAELLDRVDTIGRSRQGIPRTLRPNRTAVIVQLLTEAVQREERKVGK